MSLEKRIDAILKEFNLDIEKVSSNDISKADLSLKYFSRKGQISKLYDSLSTASPKEKPIFGKKINDLKRDCEKKINELSDIQLEKNKFKDFSYPGDFHLTGSVHPITQVIDEIKEIFSKIGFSVAYGREIESQFYNFEALNMPSYHPARDMQDTFFIDKDFLLRTHTSGTQIHFMEQNEPPIRIIAPGRVFRNEDISVRSHCQFHQIEGLYIDKKVSFSDLKGTLDYFAKQLFGNNVKTRFRPSYFPFTEPSAEMDVYWGLQSESDYRITKGTGWLEILGCGMVHNKVLKAVDYDMKFWKGFAFGIGIERLAMLLYGIDDIRSFYNGDVQFLSQF